MAEPKWEDTEEIAPSWDETSEVTAEESSPLMDTAKAVGQFAMDTVVEPVATALDYTYAPVRQAAALPAKAFKAAKEGDGGKFLDAFTDPVTQLFKPPSSAPSSAEVMEMYNVPRENEVLPGAIVNPMFSTHNEMFPETGNKEAVTVYPSAEAGLWMDSFLGGAGLNALGKVPRALKVGAGALKQESDIANKVKTIEDAVEAKAMFGKTPPPKSFEEMEGVIRTSGRMGSNLPSADRLSEIESILPNLTHKPTPLHKQMLSSGSKADEIKAAYTQLPSKEREVLEKYNQGMRQELQDRILKEATLKNPSPRDAVKAGDDIMTSIQNRYVENKERIGPMFDAIDSVEIPKQQHLEQLVNRVASEVPNVGKNLVVLEDGGIQMRPYRSDMGLSKKEYGEVKDVFDSINDGSLDFKQMQNIRETLRKAIDPANPGETADLQKLRKALLNHMEDVVQYKKPDIEVRDVFKQWAKNEGDLDVMTDVLGGKVGGFDESLKADPSKALTRIFQNTKSARIAKKTLPPEDFEALVGDLIGDIYTKSFDSAKNQVSSAKFMTGLRRHGGVLKEVDPEQYKRLEALGDLMRIIPDMPNMNPSGTAKTTALLNAGKKALNMDFGDAASDVAKVGKDIFTGRRAKNQMEGMMSGARTTPGRQSRPLLPSASNVAKGSAVFLQPQPIPLTESDVQRMNLPNSEKAQKINMIRRGVEIFD